MRTRRTLSSLRHGVGGTALAGLTALTTACASGGRAPPLTGAEAETLFEGLTGVWVVDKSSSEMPKWEFQSVGSEIPAQGWTAVLEPIFLVFQPWSTLTLRVDEESLVLVPTPGHGVEAPMSGEWIEQTPGGKPVRTRVYWDGDRLGLEHRPGSGGQVRSVLEIADGRLQVTTRIRVMGTRAPPYILVYDRDEAGEG